MSDKILKLILNSSRYDTSFIVSIDSLEEKESFASNLKVIDPALLVESILSQQNVVMTLGPCEKRFV